MKSILEDSIDRLSNLFRKFDKKAEISIDKNDLVVKHMNHFTLFNVVYDKLNTWSPVTICRGGWEAGFIADAYKNKKSEVTNFLKMKGVAFTGKDSFKVLAEKAAAAGFVLVKETCEIEKKLLEFDEAKSLFSQLYKVIRCKDGKIPIPEKPDQFHALANRFRRLSGTYTPYIHA